MSLNEPARGPASFPGYKVDDEYKVKVEALDRFQVAFRERLQTQGLEAVAFNFAAGNFTQEDHIVSWFPRTLETHTYLGLHEYGWPTMEPREGTATGALCYRACMKGIQAKYGKRHQLIITEAGLARMYKHGGVGPGDVGWLWPGETIPEEQYFGSLRWYNENLVKDKYVLGCCLFEVAHGGGQWETFRHLGDDNSGNPIGLIDRIAALREAKAARRPQAKRPKQ